MQEAKTLPNDCRRCLGAQSEPCDTCRRVLWVLPAGERSPWMAPPIEDDGTCLMYWPVKESS